MKTPRLLVAAAAATALLLSGCGTKDTAAIVNGERISESAVLATTEQVNQIVAEPMSSSSIVQQLIVLPTVVEVLKERGVTISDAAAASALSGVAEPTPYLVDMARLQLGVQQLTEADYAEITTRLADTDVRVSPRFGTFNAEDFTIQAGTPDWIASSS